MSSFRVSSARTHKHRVLVLIKGLGIGGAERLVAAACRFWDRGLFEHRVAYVLPWKDNLVPAIQRCDVEVDCIGGSHGFDPSTYLRLRALIRNWKPDIIHAHLPSAGILARIATSIPLVYTEHNLANSYRAPTRILNRLTYGRNDAVIAVSQAVATSLLAYPGPTPTVIPNGVALPGIEVDVESVRSELGIAANTPLVVHVGNIRPHKGHRILIEATKGLMARVPQAQVISIGGEKTPGDLERVRLEASRAGVADHIRFLGRREDATAFLGAADVVVNPSDVEGLPVTILEAMSLARPVVATNVGGVPSVVIHGQTGLLVPPGRPDELSEALATALTSPDATGWGKAGAELVARAFSIEKMVRQQEALYREVLHE